MAVMFVAWKLIKRTKFVKLHEMDLETDVYHPDPDEKDRDAAVGWKGKLRAIVRWIF
jgi:AAT family amino acid transporter